MSTILIWFIVLYLAGAVTRALYPYVLKRIGTGEKFDWRYMIGQVLSTLAGFIPLLGSVRFIEDLNGLGAIGWYGYVMAFVLGAGAATVGRYTQKTVGK